VRCLLEVVVVYVDVEGLDEGSSECVSQDMDSQSRDSRVI